MAKKEKIGVWSSEFGVRHSRNPALKIFQCAAVATFVRRRKILDMPDSEVKLKFTIRVHALPKTFASGDGPAIAKISGLADSPLGIIDPAWIPASFSGRFEGGIFFSQFPVPGTREKAEMSLSPLAKVAGLDLPTPGDRDIRHVEIMGAITPAGRSARATVFPLAARRVVISKRTTSNSHAAQERGGKDFRKSEIRGQKSEVRK